MNQAALAAAAEAECEKWMAAPGRQRTKLEVIKAERLARWRGLQEEETQTFISRVMDPKIQNMVETYLASLKKK